MLRLMMMLLVVGWVALPTLAEEAYLSRDAADAAGRQAWSAYQESAHARHLLDMLDRGVIHSPLAPGLAMPISVELIWDEGQPMPEHGYPVYISMHGGGAFTEEENHDQWEIQKTRYPGVRGLYICPHSPLDTWDQWHNEAIFALIETLVQAVWLREDVDPNRVYLTGYCSGGNGVYQLGPILADHFAAVSATKALSEGAPLANLRNCPIDLQWGEHDEEPVNRPQHNHEKVAELYELFEQDRLGYSFREIEHWRQGRFVNDKSTVTWLSRWTREPLPERVVWVQGGDVRASSNPIRRDFYWLSISDDTEVPTESPARIVAELDRAANAVRLQVEGYDRVGVWLNDAMLDLDRGVTIFVNGQAVESGLMLRQAETIESSIGQLRDPRRVFSHHAWVQVPASD